MSLADRVRELRTRMGVDVDTFARMAGAHPGAVREWEAGRSTITPDELDAATRAAGLRVRDLALPPDSWPLDPLYFKSSGSGALVDAGAHRVIMEMRRCVADLADLHQLLDRPRADVPRLAPPRADRPPYAADLLAAQARDRLDLDATAPIESMVRLFEQRRIALFVASSDLLPPSVQAASTTHPLAATLVNDLGSDPRLRFALAHEICHLMVDSPEAGAEIVTSEWTRLAYDRSEIRADAFAACFLAPAPAVRALVRGAPSDEANVVTVARVFGIGRVVAINRIAATFELADGVRDAMEMRAPGRWQHELPEQLPPTGLRSGVLVEPTLAALVAGKIDRVRARSILGVPLTEPLPARPGVPAELLAPVRDPLADVRNSVDRWLHEHDADLDTPVEDPVPVEGGWQVRVSLASGAQLLHVSPALDVRAAQS